VTQVEMAAAVAEKDDTVPDRVGPHPAGEDVDGRGNEGARVPA
jgi:hypothetical protein